MKQYCMLIHSPKEQLFFSVARITAASKYEESVGTAFFVGLPNVDPPRHFVVTARHIVEGGQAGDLYFLSSTGAAPTLAPPLPYRWTRDIWTFHSDPQVDVAIAPLEKIDFDALPGDVTMFVVPETDFLAKWERFDQPALEIVRRPQPVEEVVVIGFPVTTSIGQTGSQSFAEASPRHRSQSTMRARRSSWSMPHSSQVQVVARLYTFVRAILRGSCFSASYRVCCRRRNSIGSLRQANVR